MLRPPVFAFAITQSIPAMICLASVPPFPSATRTGTMRAPGATPLYPSASEPVSFPAMMPAMWVPCPKESPAPSPVESKPGTSFPDRSSPLTDATPESMTATSMPLPSMPLSTSASAPIAARTFTGEPICV